MHNEANLAQVLNRGSGWANIWSGLRIKDLDYTSFSGSLGCLSVGKLGTSRIAPRSGERNYNSESEAWQGKRTDLTVVLLCRCKAIAFEQRSNCAELAPRRVGFGYAALGRRQPEKDGRTSVESYSPALATRMWPKRVSVPRTM